MKRKEREKREKLTRLRELKKSYMDKARECAVYDHEAGYYYWYFSAVDVSNRIYSLTHGGASRRPSDVAIEYLSYHEAKRPFTGLLEG